MLVAKPVLLHRALTGTVQFCEIAV